MQLSSALACLLFGVLPSLSQASPIDNRQARPARFALKTQVYPGIKDCGSNKDGLYVFSYHTGAGLGVAAAEASNPGTWFELNDTTLQYDFANNQNGPWPVMLEYGPYQAFNEISISIADGPATPGFFTNSSGLQSNESSQGWIACDWWLGSPMIFSLNGYGTNPLPTSCSLVNLVPQPLLQ